MKPIIIAVATAITFATTACGTPERAPEPTATQEAPDTTCGSIACVQAGTCSCIITSTGCGTACRNQCDGGAGGAIQLTTTVGPNSYFSSAIGLNVNHNTCADGYLCAPTASNSPGGAHWNDAYLDANGNWQWTVGSGESGSPNNQSVTAQLTCWDVLGLASEAYTISTAVSQPGAPCAIGTPSIYDFAHTENIVIGYEGDLGTSKSSVGLTSTDGIHPVAFACSNPGHPLAYAAVLSYNQTIGGSGTMNNTQITYANSAPVQLASSNPLFCGFASVQNNNPSLLWINGLPYIGAVGSGQAQAGSCTFGVHY